MLSTTLLLMGMVIYCGMSLVIALYAFKVSIAQGLLCLILPLYTFVFAQKRTTPRIFFQFWLLGILALVCGTLLKS